MRIKGPKKGEHKRTIEIADGLVTLLSAEIDKVRRVVAGVPHGSPMDLSLVKLPKGALIFPAAPEDGTGNFSPTKLRRPRDVTKVLSAKARKLGYPDIRPCHDLSSAHETILLDQGVGVHVVAKRCGHDPATLLRVYAKRTRKADTSAAAVISTLSKGVLGTQ